MMTKINETKPLNKQLNKQTKINKQLTNKSN